ncbi:hypothetical protein SAM40697_3131 [Streptomyces ambofaciens]|uniref:PE-PGRS family protein n=1 Tax=Streptomyces ambofaciens TaxID=1889 RepID=A0ABM6B030_STRAM|nr:hypothetical protein SAM40697_3131 [Streptomyces ambofaciens]
MPEAGGAADDRAVRDVASAGGAGRGAPRGERRGAGEERGDGAGEEGADGAGPGAGCAGGTAAGAAGGRTAVAGLDVMGAPSPGRGAETLRCTGRAGPVAAGFPAPGRAGGTATGPAPVPVGAARRAAEGSTVGVAEGSVAGASRWAAGGSGVGAFGAGAVRGAETLRCTGGGVVREAVAEGPVGGGGAGAGASGVGVVRAWSAGAGGAGCAGRGGFARSRGVACRWTEGRAPVGPSGRPGEAGGEAGRGGSDVPCGPRDAVMPGVWGVPGALPPPAGLLDGRPVALPDGRVLPVGGREAGGVAAPLPGAEVGWVRIAARCTGGIVDAGRGGEPGVAPARGAESWGAVSARPASRFPGAAVERSGGGADRWTGVPGVLGVPGVEVRAGAAGVGPVAEGWSRGGTTRGTGVPPVARSPAGRPAGGVAPDGDDDGDGDGDGD